MRTFCTILLVAALAPGATAQTPSANPISDGIRGQWNGAKRNIQQSAELMSAENYDYRPVDGVRTFGELLAHVAGANYAICAAAKPEKTPFAENHFEKTATTRPAIIKATADAIAYCDAVFAGPPASSMNFSLIPEPVNLPPPTMTSVPFAGPYSGTSAAGGCARETETATATATAISERRRRISASKMAARCRSCAGR